MERGPGSDLLFTYGTLMPGHLRWAMLAGDSVEQRRDSVAGQLYDTGHGWPAARFAAGADTDGDRCPPAASTIPGWVVRFGPSRLGAMLPTLDEMEGIGRVPDGRADPYRRILVPTVLGAAWAYHATSVGRRWRPIDAWLDQPEA